MLCISSHSENNIMQEEQRNKMVSACTCSVCGGAVAQFVADRAGEVAAEGSLGHNQSRSVLGDRPHGVSDGDLLVKPAEVGVRPPGLAANQRGVRHVDAD